MNQGDITIAEATSGIKQVIPPSKVYNIPDGQGRMASYYNAMELPEHYTSSHGILRTNHFIPVGYCCMDDIAPRPRGYLGKNPRLVSSGRTGREGRLTKWRPGYRATVNATATAVQHNEMVRTEERAVTLEPRVPPPSPEHQLIIIADGTAELPEETVPVVSRDTTSVPTQAPFSAVAPSYQSMQTPVQPQPQQHLSQQPAARSCASCTHHSAQSQATATLANSLPISRPSSQTPPYPPAICRRWLIGTCRRGPACRNRHQVLLETDSQLHAIKEAHLATMRFYNSGVELRAPALAGAPPGEVKEQRAENEASKELPPLLNWADEVVEESNPSKESKQPGFVEAHIDGIRQVKIPISALTEQFKGLKLEGEKKERPTRSTTPADADDTRSEPLPDYSLAMPPNLQPITTKKPPSSIPTPTQPIRHRQIRTAPFIPLAGRFRSAYDPNRLQNLSHLPFYPRRNVPQDFVPRHILNRALRQHIAGSLRGRRLLEKREVRGASGAWMKAILAGMKGDDADCEKSVEDNDEAEVKDERADGTTEVAVKKEEVEVEVDVKGRSSKIEEGAETSVC